MTELTKEFFKKTLDKKLQKFATKDDLKVFAKKDDLAIFATKDDLNTIKADLTIIKLDLSEVKATVARIDKRDLEDSNAFAKDILKINRRLTKLEKIKQDKLPEPLHK